MRVVIACGASGGHIFPGITLAYELAKEKDSDTLMLCSRKPLDVEILQKSGLAFVVMPYNPLIFTLNPLRISLFFIKLVIGAVLSLRLLSRFRPHCVVGFGGFVSVPVVFAAWLLRIPTIIHEQNLIAGLSNRIGSIFADRVAVSFEDTKRFFKKCKVVKIGNPVRRRFLILDKTHSRERFGLDKDRFTIFITGGSQGANFINNTILDAFNLMDYGQKKALQVIHVTGKENYESVRDGYIKEGMNAKVFSFLDEIDRAYTASDLVIARAGATTIAELAYFGKPSILIPYPKRNVHQTENAHFISDNKAGITIQEKALDAKGAKELILSLSGDPKRLEEMSCNSRRLGTHDASRLLAQEVSSLARSV